jgi:hypothetical protein
MVCESMNRKENYSYFITCVQSMRRGTLKQSETADNADMCCQISTVNAEGVLWWRLATFIFAKRNNRH